MQGGKKRKREMGDVMRDYGAGFARRRRVAYGGWRETVTHYMPEPWLVALEHDKIGLPFRPGHRPEANR